MYLVTRHSKYGEQRVGIGARRDRHLFEFIAGKQSMKFRAMKAA